MTKLSIVDVDVLLSKQRQILVEVFQEQLQELNIDATGDEVLNTSSLCKMLNKSRQTIENWCEQKILKKRYIGNSVFFLKSEVLTAMSDKKVNP